MNLKNILTIVTAAMAITISGAALADGHSHDHDRALVILTSDSLETQGMAMILSNAMQQQGTELNILLCDAAGDLAVEGHDAGTFNTPPGHEMDALSPYVILGMLINNGASVDVCAIYLPNRDYDQNDLRAGVGVAAPGPMAEMMRDASINTYTF